jgi:hypothetical protein
MVMKMSVDIKYTKCIVTVTCVFCVHSSLWYFVCAIPCGILCTVPYGILCAQFLVVFCVHSSLWYFVCAVPCDILCAQFLMLFFVCSSIWYFLCTVPYGILCAEYVVVFCVHGSLWYSVCRVPYDILRGHFLVAFCVHSSLWYYHYQHNNCTSVAKTCYSHVFSQAVHLCLLPFSLHLCWCRPVCPGHSKLFFLLVRFLASVIMCMEPTSNAEWVKSPSL